MKIMNVTIGMFELCLLVAFYALMLLFLGVYVGTVVFIFQAAAISLIVKYPKIFQQDIVLLNYPQPSNMDYEHPTSCGMVGGRNISIEFQSKVDNCPVKIGVWHILPKSAYERNKGRLEDLYGRDQLSALLDEELANSNTPIMMYCHGNSSTRAMKFRRQVYRFFQDLECHTVAFDYRGCGDSSPVKPSEAGAVEDALMIYNWIITATGGRAPVFVWGHSQGTGVASHMLGNLEDLSNKLLDRSLPPPKGLILEAPLNSLAGEIAYQQMVKLASWPYFRAPSVASSEGLLQSEINLPRAIGLPVLMLHARDGFVEPHQVGETFDRALLEAGTNGGASVVYHSFDENENVGPRGICTVKTLDLTVGNFVAANAEPQTA